MSDHETPDLLAALQASLNRARQDRLAPAPASETAREECHHSYLGDADFARCEKCGDPRPAPTPPTTVQAACGECGCDTNDHDAEGCKALGCGCGEPTTLQADRDAGQVRVPNLPRTGQPDWDAKVADLIERSSLNTPKAKALRATVSDERAARVVARSKEMDTPDAGQVRLTEDEKAAIYKHVPINRWDAEADIYAEVERILAARVDAALVEGANIGIYMRMDALAARQSDPVATERVEWGVRWDEVVEQVDVDPTRRPDIGYYPGGTLVRRTVTTGEWTEVGE